MITLSDRVNSGTGEVPLPNSCSGSLVHRNATVSQRWCLTVISALAWSGLVWHEEISGSPRCHDVIAWLLANHLLRSLLDLVRLKGSSIDLDRVGKSQLDLCIVFAGRSLRVGPV